MAEHSTEGRRVLALLDVPPDPDHPNGYSARYHAFLSAIAERWSLDILALHHDRALACSAFVPAGVTVHSSRCAHAAPHPLNASGLEGALRRAHHYLLDPLPYLSYPRDVPELATFWQPRPPDLVLFFLPYTAHLWRKLPTPVPGIFLIEEPYEKALAWSNPGQHPVKAWWVRTTEKARVQRLYKSLPLQSGRLVAISERENDWFSRFCPPQHVVTVPHGIDCDHYHPAEAEQDIDVALFGIMGGANLEAMRALYASRSALPREGEGDARWAFVGKDPPPELTELRDDGVLVTGFVPDLRPYYWRSKVVVVPAQYGAGVKTTLLQAWASGCPVVATSFAANGVHAQPGKNLLVADSEPEILNAVAQLLRSAELRASIGQEGRRTAVEWHGLRQVATGFADLCEKTMGQ
jgi:glycosyltransferase involved in cell wall biosynthesis